jgi:hypothetical protein
MYTLAGTMARAILCGGLACLLSILGPSAVVPSASAAGGRCDPSTSQPFLPWLDPGLYVLPPGGAMESGSNRWKLARGARLVPGNEPFYAHDRADSQALSLPAGSSATTTRVCLDLLSPTLRFFAANPGPRSSRLQVAVRFRGLAGALLGTVTVASIAAGPAWAPTPPLLLLANVTAPVGTQDVQLVFTPTGSSGAWRIDDVYVDPWISH